MRRVISTGLSLLLLLAGSVASGQGADEVIVGSGASGPALSALTGDGTWARGDTWPITAVR